MLLIHVSVSTHPSMTLSTSVIHLATVANLVQIHYALTALLVLQACALRVKELKELHPTVRALLMDIMTPIPLKSIAYLAPRLLVKVVIHITQAPALCAMEIIE